MSKVINASHRLSCKLLVVITTFSILGSTTNLTPSIVYAQSSLPDQALSRATEEYARDIGISLSEAIHRLTLQNSIGELDVALSQKEAASYGGLWIQHQPSFKIFNAVIAQLSWPVKHNAAFVQVPHVAFHVFG